MHPRALDVASTTQSQNLPHDLYQLPARAAWADRDGVRWSCPCLPARNKPPLLPHRHCRLPRCHARRQPSHVRQCPLPCRPLTSSSLCHRQSATQPALCPLPLQFPLLLPVGSRLPPLTPCAKLPLPAVPQPVTATTVVCSPPGATASMPVVPPGASNVAADPSPLPFTPASTRASCCHHTFRIQRVFQLLIAETTPQQPHGP